MSRIDEFGCIREALKNHAEVVPHGDQFREPIYRRLALAISHYHSGRQDAVGLADLAVLIRHVLRRETLRQNGADQDLILATEFLEGWTDDWAGYGLEQTPAANGAVRLQAREWRPSWLPLSEKFPPAEPVFAEAPRRLDTRLPADPFLSAVGFDSYLSEGQRRAVRAAATAPNGSTLVVNLPTGSGKSLCAHIRALIDPDQPGTVIVVVPTTTLCMDQEQAIAGHFDHPTAYYGTGTPRESERVAIRDRIADGTQGIVFTSPESLIGSLARSIHKAASHGLVKLFAIDEAHLVAEWGVEFRSSFQQVAGLRSGLLRITPTSGFPTLLMTATLTSTSLATLRTLFPPDRSEFKVVSAAQIRPEPAYWQSYAETQEDKDSRVVEAVRNCPRPAILYTSTKSDATRYTQLLVDRGFKRLARVTGDTSSRERSDIMRWWRDGSLDLVVATSAFGLGVDHADVGTVIHACVPESVDRFYQEVGRGGRDGTASLSILVWTHSDREVAKALSRKTIIGVERGRRRWTRMFRASENLGDDLYRVYPDTTPGLTEADIDMKNQRNEEWNVRTLTLMSRARLLRLDSERPAFEPASISTNGVRHGGAALPAFRNSIVVRLIDTKHLTRETWEDRVEQARRADLDARTESLRLLDELLRQESCVGRLLVQVYSGCVARGDSLDHLTAAYACGGCHSCRTGDLPVSVTSPLVTGRFWSESSSRSPLNSNMQLDRGVAFLAFRPQDLQLLPRLLDWIVASGLGSVILQNSVLDTDISSLVLESITNQRTRPISIIDRYKPIEEPLPQGVCMLVANNSNEVPPIFLSGRSARAPQHRMLLAPIDIRNPLKPHASLLSSGSMNVHQAGVLSQELGL